ncbi:MAG: ABC transporter permease subunit [Planctomycetota bacterium]
MARAWLLLAVYSIGLFLALEVMLVPAVLYWPDFAENVDNLKAVAPLPMLRALIDEMDFGGAYAYLVGQHFFKACNTVGTAAAVLFAAGAIAGEAHRNTLELFLARPFSRTRLLTERFLLGLAALVVPIVLSTLTIVPLADHVGEVLEYEPLLLSAAHQCSLLSAVYALVFFLSTRATNPMPLAVGMIFVTSLMFAIYVVEGVSQYSLYRLTDIHDFMRIDATRSLDWRVVGPLLGVSAAFYLASVQSFRRRLPN